MARLIHPDGSEVDVYRVGAPNIVEQLRMVRRAAEGGAEALVVECMAVRPDLQPLAELRLIRSHIGVITNARADHLDVMGPTVDDVALALAQTTPRNGHLFTAERERAGVFERVARERGSLLHIVGSEGIGDADMAGFHHLEHAENVGLALAVCTHIGVDRRTALAGMWAAAPDPGVLQRFKLRTEGKEIDFVNAFAANDPDSTLLIWERLGLREKNGAKRVVLANCRRDRLHRSSQMAELVARRLDADHVVLSGEGTQLVARQCLSQGLSRQRLTDLGGLDARAVFERVLALFDDNGIVFGIGNIVGLGEEVVLLFRQAAISHG